MQASGDALLDEAEEEVRGQRRAGIEAEI